MPAIPACAAPSVIKPAVHGKSVARSGANGHAWTTPLQWPAARVICHLKRRGLPVLLRAQYTPRLVLRNEILDKADSYAGGVALTNLCSDRHAALFYSLVAAKPLCRGPQ